MKAVQVKLVLLGESRAAFGLVRVSHLFRLRVLTP